MPAQHGLPGPNVDVPKPPEGVTPARQTGTMFDDPDRCLRAVLSHDSRFDGQFVTVADINTAEVIRYATPAAELFDAASRVKAWLAACQARPAFKAMWAKRDAEPA